MYYTTYNIHDSVYYTKYNIHVCICILLSRAGAFSQVPQPTCFAGFQVRRAPRLALCALFLFVILLNIIINFFFFVIVLNIIIN